jgi:acyl transferase domain-containing protein
VNDRLRDWETAPGTPRRAGVSSFGIGGTNAHVILEEAPGVENSDTSETHHLLMVSAKTDAALDEAVDNLSGYLSQHPDICLRDVAYTLCAGRIAFSHRAFVVCRDVGEAVEKLNASRNLFRGSSTAGERSNSGAEPFTGLDTEEGLIAAGRLWIDGRDINPEDLYPDNSPRRIPLPSYPFERRRCWVDPQPLQDTRGELTGEHKEADVSDWFYAPSWKRLPMAGGTSHVSGNVLIFADDEGIGEMITGGQVVIVHKGTGFERLGDYSYQIDPEAPEDYASLMADLRNNGVWPESIFHLWALTRRSFTDLTQMDRGMSFGCHSLFFLAQAIGDQGIRDPLRLTVVTNGTQQVSGDETMDPVKAALLGPAKVIPQEYPYITCRVVDTVLPVDEKVSSDRTETNRLRDLLMGLTAGDVQEPVIALRGLFAWAQRVEPIPMGSPEPATMPLKENGVYLITGGLGGIGRTLAGAIARSVAATLVLTGASGLPAREEWEDWLALNGNEEPVSLKIKSIR